MAKDDHGDFTPVMPVTHRRVDFAVLVKRDEQLRKAPLVEALGDDKARVLFKLAIGRRYPDKVIIFRQGDPGDTLCLVIRGEVRLFMNHDENTVEFGRVGKGDVFGEGEVLEGTAVRSSSALASGEVELVALPRRTLLEYIQERPALRDYLDGVQSKRRTVLSGLASLLAKG